MATGNTLQRAATEEALLQDALVREFELDLRSVYRRLTRLIRQLLADWDIDGDGRLISQAANLGRAIGFRNQIRQLLEDAGFTDLATRATDVPLTVLAERVLATSRIANETSRQTPSALQAVQALRDLRLADLLGVGEDIAKGIARAVFDGVLGLRPVDSLVLDVADLLDMSAARARTIYDTGVSTFSRQIDLLQSTGDPDELFVYVGPVDAVIRPFCETWVGKVLTRAEIDELDNGQLPDVFLTCGGFNCRHALKRVSRLDDELRALHTSGGRVPEVAAALKRAA